MWHRKYRENEAISASIEEMASTEAETNRRKSGRKVATMKAEENRFESVI
jgi:hypothetical protein